LADHLLRPLLSVVFPPPSHSEVSKLAQQLAGSQQLAGKSQQAQAAWRSLFFKGNASHHSNSLTTVSFPPLPLLLQHFNPQQQQQQPQ